MKTFTLGWKKVNAPLAKSFACRLAVGSYRYYVYARDLYGLAQSSVGSAKLVVK